MKKPIQISIPAPCHENWHDMKPVEKGRFCDSCQKKVHDFTASPDKVILEAFAKDSRLCGRFRVDQLDRELIIPKEKSTIWTAASAAAISFLALGNYAVQAQDTIPTEQHTRTNYMLGKFAAPPQKSIVTGIVSDEAGGLPNAVVVNRNSGIQVTASEEGFYKIAANTGDVLEVAYPGYMPYSTTVTNTTINIEIRNMLGEVRIDVYGEPAVKRTFFGRIFHSIGNIFR